MKKIMFLVVFLLSVIYAPLAGAGLNVNVSIGIPAPLVFAGPPDVVLVPSGPAYVYMVPGRPGLYYYNGFWYRFHGAHWYWAHTYDGRWRYIETHLVPRYIINVPPDYYRYLPPRYYRIHYKDLDRQWYRWNKSRYWDKYDWYKREYREYERRRHVKGLQGDIQKPPPRRDLKKERRDQKRDRRGSGKYPDDGRGRRQGR